MADAFLHRRSVFDKHKDAYGLKNPIKQMRVARSWDNPITRNKREKSLHSWANSFAGKRHYRKLSRHNALHLHEEVESLGIPAVYSGSTLTLADGSVVTGISPGIRGKCNVTINAVREGDFIRLIPDWDEQGNFFKREVHSKYELDYTNHGTKYDHSVAYLNDLGALAHHEAFHLCEDVGMNKVSIEEICDTLNRYAAARWLPFKADLLHGADGKHISLHSGNTYLDIGYAPSGELEVYDAEVAHPLNVLTHWDSVDEIAGHLLSLAVRQAAKNESVYEKLSFEKGHKDSKGSDAPWVIRSHDDGKVLASFANKDDAVQHLARMKNYSKEESFMSLKSALRESHAKKLESFAGASKKPERVGSPKREKMGEIIFEPVVNFKPQQYAVYEIDDDGDELECIFSGTMGSAKKKLGDAIGSDPNKKFHVVAIAYTPRGQLADSEVVWSDLRQELVPAKNESAEAGITSRDVQAAARSAWSSSGATDFKLDIVRLGDHIIIYAKGPNGEDNVGISWHVHIPSILNSYETPHVEQFAVDSKGAWPKEPERTFDAKDLDELENQLVDEFEALQEAIDIGKEDNLN